ncbi:zinc finger protein 567-like [Scaptodrosophila lebanonensis]|uniref:Zinc finger protein 567-like n=1 Tax=Drosophila lebanonensis TaxID=7225 RepID=A0A6J2TQR2_DROLE|nr:zinc finger protein 567-like [Scaptodrosophila lebanonensis]
MRNFLAGPRECIGSHIWQPTSMKQRRNCPVEETQYVSIAAAEKQAALSAARLRQAEEDELDYAVCLDDMQLFAQLGDLVNLEDDSEVLLDCCADAQGNCDLFDLVNDLSSENHQNIMAAAPMATDTMGKAKEKPRRIRVRKRDACHTCDVCQRCFREPYNLRIHKMTHTDEKPHICDTCGKGFRQLNKLRIHYVTHSKARPYECDICGKGFRYANYLAVHRRLHTGEKPYACAICGMAFHSIHARRSHTKLRHAAEAGNEKATTTLPTSALSYTCPICGRVMTDQCYLNTHLKRHYNQRDFACPQCGKCFFSSSELKHHQIAHTQLRPFACAQCGSRFLRKSNYKQHLKIHAR